MPKKIELANKDQRPMTSESQTLSFDCATNENWLCPTNVVRVLWNFQAIIHPLYYDNIFFELINIYIE